MAVAEAELCEVEVIEPRPELKVFRDVNEQMGRRLPWERRAGLIREQFPTVETLDWKRAFDDDIELFAHIIRDVLKLDQTDRTKPADAKSRRAHDSGPRRNLDTDRGLEMLKQYMGTDYSMLRFAEAFTVLAGSLSLRHLARKTGLSYSAVRRLLNSMSPPSATDMEAIARGFNKHPSYFMEWRSAYIVAALHARIEGSPEATVSLYWKLTRGDS